MHADVISILFAENPGHKLECMNFFENFENEIQNFTRNQLLTPILNTIACEISSLAIKSRLCTADVILCKIITTIKREVGQEGHEGIDLHRWLARVQHNSCCYATMQHLMTSFCNI